MPDSGYRPVTTDGTAYQVELLTAVVLRNQVDPAASSARFGNSSASTSPSEVITAVSGSSSSRTITTGAGSSIPASAARGSSANTRRDVPEESRNSPRNTSGAIAA